MAPRNLLAVAASLALLGCDASVRAGGAGSEAGNALAVRIGDPSGAPVALARVQLRRPDSRDTAPAFSGLTDSDGIVRFRVEPGPWSILARSGDLAAWSVRSASDPVATDTLRPTARISGFLEGAGGAEIALPGLGIDAGCDADGFFQIPSLPAGALPVSLGAQGASARLEVAAGVDALVVGGSGSLPDSWPSLPADSLVPWASRALPASLPAPALGDTGSFSVAVRLRRTDSVAMVRGIDWTDGSGSGVQVDWRGRDTLVLRLDGIAYRVSGFALDTGWEQLGISWDGNRVAVVRGADSVLALTTRTFADRSGWGSPRFGTAGAAGVRWVAFQRGGRIADWLRRLAILSD